MKGEVRLFDQVSKPVAAISCQVAVMSAASKLAFPKEFLRKSDLPPPASQHTQIMQKIVQMLKKLQENPFIVSKA